MRSSSLVGASLAFGVLGSLGAAGCQLIAGIHGDAKLTSGSSAGGSAGSATTSGGSGGSGGTGGTGGCAASADCDGGVCLDGKCVTPKCVVSGDPQDIFTAADLGNHVLSHDELVAVVDGDRIHLVVHDQDANVLLARTWSPNDAVKPTSAVVTYDPMNMGCFFAFGRAESGQLHVVGRLGDEVGDLVFSTSNVTVQPSPTFKPFPAPPAQCVSPANHLDDLLVQYASGATRYAATCQGGGNRTLIAGSDTQAPDVIASGADTDSTLSLREYLVDSAGKQLMILHGKEEDGLFFRTGATAADLAKSTPLSFTSQAGALGFEMAALTPPGGTGMALIAGWYVPPPAFDGHLFAGVVTDYASLGMVPPPGMTPLTEIKGSMPSFDALGHMIADQASYYLPGSDADDKGVNLTWLDAKMEHALLFVSSIYRVPAGDSGKVVSVAALKVGFDLHLLWTEAHGTAMSVRGNKVFCSY